MQIPDWLLKSAHVLAVPILATKIEQNVSYIFHISIIPLPLCLVILGIIILSLGLFKRRKLFSLALIITGIWFLVYASIVAYYNSRYKIPLSNILFAWIAGIIIFGGCFYLQHNKNKGK
jgi:hypothetical protein